MRKPETIRKDIERFLVRIEKDAVAFRERVQDSNSEDVYEAWLNEQEGNVSVAGSPDWPSGTLYRKLNPERFRDEADTVFGGMRFLDLVEYVGRESESDQLEDILDTVVVKIKEIRNEQLR